MQGTYDPDRFMQGIENMAAELVQNYSFISEGNRDLFKQEKTVIGLCLRCGSGVFEGKQNYYCENKPKSEWTMIENHHAPIVSRETFDSVQAIFAQNSRKNNIQRQERKYVFRGKVICGCCGHVMGRSFTPNASFSCRYSSVNPEADCHGLKIMESDLEREVFKKVQNKAKEMAEIFKGRNELHESGRIEQVEYAKQELYKNFVREKMGVTEFSTKRSAYIAEIKQLTQLLSTNLVGNNSKIIEFSEEIILAEKLTQIMVEVLIDKIQIFPGGKFGINWTPTIPESHTANKDLI